MTTLRRLCLPLVLSWLVLGPAFAAPPKPKGLEKKARAVVGSLAKADFAKVRGLFDAAMRKQLAPGSLKKIWTGLNQQVGSFGGIGAVTQERAGSLRTVTVTCSFSIMAIDLLLSFNARGRLAGIRFTPAKRGFSPRPQTPKAPFPYDSREVSFTNAKGGGEFAGTLTTPKGSGPFPAALLVTGSGSQDRDETIFGHKPFLVIADHLTRQGIAVLRVDDRGAGATKAPVKGATVELHASDAEAALVFLRKQPKIDGAKMGIIGHSEGGLIGAIVAARNNQLGFLVMLGGPGVSGEHLNPMQMGALLRAQGGFSKEGMEAIVAAQKKLMRLIATDATSDVIRATLRVTLETAQKYSPGDKSSPADIGAALDQQLAMIISPWYRSFVRLDPSKHLTRVRCPLLALTGEKDTQVPPGPNLAAIRDAAKAGANTRVETYEVKGVNHLFQHAKTGLLDEYGKLTETFDPETLSQMSTWILRVTQ